MSKHTNHSISEEDLASKILKVTEHNTLEEHAQVDLIMNSVREYALSKQDDAREGLINEIVNKGRSKFASKKEYGDMKIVEVEVIKTQITDVELRNLQEKK